MSFILDALKKSELERQRQASPGLEDYGFSRPSARLPVWAIALGLLLAVNLLVVTVILVRGGLRPAPPPQAARAGAPATGVPATASPDAESQGVGSQGAGVPAAESPTGTELPATGSPAAGSSAVAAKGAAHPDHFSPFASAPLYAPEIPVAGGSAAPANRTLRDSLPLADTARADTSTAAAVTHANRRRDPVLTDNDYQPADSEVLPTINELNFSGTQALPELHLDVHVFATKAADRFVYINMHKYHEGATLAEGPTIERIQRNGVILSYQGLRFLLPRQ